MNKYIKLSDVPAVVEELTGDRPGISTVFRWADCQRPVVLQTVYAAGAKRTTRRWIEEYFERMADFKAGYLPEPLKGKPARTPKRERAIAEAEARLTAALAV